MGISIAYGGKLADPTLVGKLIEDITEKARSAGWPFKTVEELVAIGHVKSPDLRGLSLMPHPECEWLSFHLDGEGVFVNHFYHSMLTSPEHLAMVAEALSASASLVRGELPAKKPKSKSKAKGAESKEKAKTGKKGGKAAAGKGGGAPGFTVVVPDLAASFSPAYIEEGRRYNWTKTQFAGPDVHIAVCALLRYVKERYAPDLWVEDESGYFETGDREDLEGRLAHVDRILSIATQAVEGAAKGGKPLESLSDLVDRLNEELASANEKLH